MENDIAPLDVKQSRQYNDFGTQIKDKAWQRKLIGDGFSERKKLKFGFSEVCYDLHKEGNRECRSFVIGLQRPASGVDMLNFPNIGYFFPRDSSLPCNELQTSTLSEAVVGLSHADKGAGYEKNDGAMSAIGRLSNAFTRSKPFISKPLFPSKSTRVRSVLINSFLAFPGTRFCSCFTLCLLLSLQFSSAQKVERALTLAVKGSDQLAVGDEQHRTSTASELTSLSQTNGQFNSEREPKMSHQKMFRRDHNELRNHIQNYHAVIMESDEMDISDHRKRNRTRKNTLRGGERMQNINSSFNFSLRHDLSAKNAEVKIRRLENASFRRKSGVGDLVDIPFTSRERDSLVASSLSQHRKRPVLSNVSSPNGNVRHVSSLAGDEHVFLTPVSGSLLDIPVVNLESAYKVRRLTWNHRQAGKSLSQSNSIFRKGFSKVLRGTPSADKNLIRYKRSHQSGSLGVRNLPASSVSHELAHQLAGQEEVSKRHTLTTASGYSKGDEKMAHEYKNGKVNGNEVSDEDSGKDTDNFRRYDTKTNVSVDADENLPFRGNFASYNDSFRSEGDFRSFRIHQRNLLRSQDLDTPVLAGAMEEVYSSQKFLKSVRDKDKDRSLGSPKSSVLRAPVNQSDATAVLGAGTRSQARDAGSYDSRTINTSSIGFSKHDQAERVQTSAKIPSDLRPMAARDEFQAKNIKTKSPSSLLAVGSEEENFNLRPLPVGPKKSRSLMGIENNFDVQTAMNVIAQNTEYSVLQKAHKTGKKFTLSEINNPDIKNAVFINSMFEEATGDASSNLKPVISTTKVTHAKNTSEQEQMKNDTLPAAIVNETKINLSVYNSHHPHRHENSRSESPFDVSFVREDIRRKEKEGNLSHEHQNSSDFDAEMKSRSPRSFKGKARDPDFRFAKNSRKQAAARDNDGLDRHNSGGSNDDRAKSSGGACGLGYYTCNDGSCVIADRFCNGEADCPKGEDEPAHCSLLASEKSSLALDERCLLQLIQLPEATVPASSEICAAQFRRSNNNNNPQNNNSSNQRNSNNNSSSTNSDCSSTNRNSSNNNRNSSSFSNSNNNSSTAATSATDAVAAVLGSPTSHKSCSITCDFCFYRKDDCVVGVARKSRGKLSWAGKQAKFAVPSGRAKRRSRATERPVEQAYKLKNSSTKTMS
ncbi:Low-density lipoprotein (LDL) receptor class A repeat [Trinorchestia longiramus]|nr:Low-density lipoprotein (LDL) receptor class A repeat [Trinorchestia longiramus]